MKHSLLDPSPGKRNLGSSDRDQRRSTCDPGRRDKGESRRFLLASLLAALVLS